MAGQHHGSLYIGLSPSLSLSLSLSLFVEKSTRGWPQPRATRGRQSPTNGPNNMSVVGVAVVAVTRSAQLCFQIARCKMRTVGSDRKLEHKL